KLKREGAVRLQTEGRAIEHQLILSADLIHIHDREIAFDDAGNRNIETHVPLAAGIGRAVGYDEQLGAGFGEAFDDILVIAPLRPDVLADRESKPDAAEACRARQRSRSKDAPLVEYAIIGQVHLETHSRDGALVKE